MKRVRFNPNGLNVLFLTKQLFTMENHKKTVLSVLHEYYIKKGRDYLEAQKQVEKIKIQLLNYLPRRADRSSNSTKYFNTHLLEHKDNLTANSELYNIIRALHFGFGIPYKEFNKNGFRVKKKYIFPPNMPNFSSGSEFHLLDFSLTTDKGALKKLYKKVFIKTCFREMSVAYKIFDYLGKGLHEPDETKESYFKDYLEIHDLIYRKIEKRIRLNTAMTYTRILALPYREQNKKIVEELKDKNRDKIFGEIIPQIFDNCSGETFHHLSNCINEFGIGRVQIYVTCLPSRNHQFGICDDTFVFSEHYRVTKKQNIKPEYLRLYRLLTNNKEAKKLKILYDLEFKRFEKHKYLRFLNKEHFMTIFENYISSYVINTDNNQIEDELDFINKKINHYNKVFTKKLALKTLPK